MLVHSIGVGQPIRAVYEKSKEVMVRVAVACKNVAIRMFTAIADFFRYLGAKVGGLFRRRVAPAPFLVPAVVLPVGGAFPHQQAQRQYRGTPSSVIAKLTQYLPDALAILQAGDLRKEQVDILSKLLQEGNWEDIREAYRETPEDLARDGLKASERKLITAEQFATVTFFYSLMVDFPGQEIHIEPLFEADRSVREAAREAIRGTMNHPPQRFVKDNADFKEEKLQEFFAQMQSQPKSEQVFFSVLAKPYQWNKLKKQKIQDVFINKSQTIMEMISTDQKQGFNVFHQFEKDANTYRMTPSLSMMQQFLHTYARQGDAVQIDPVITLVQEEESMVKKDFWMMRLPFPGVSSLEKIECLKAPHRVDMIGYDFYQAYTCSEIPKSVRKACLEAISIIKELKQEIAKEYKVVLQAIYESMVAMNDPWFQLSSDEYKTKKDDPAGVCHFLMKAFYLSEDLMVFKKIMELCKPETSDDDFNVMTEDIKEAYKDSFQIATIAVKDKLKERGFYGKHGITKTLWAQVENQYFSLRP